MLYFDLQNTTGMSERGKETKNMMKVGSMSGAALQGAGGGMQTGTAGLQNDSVSKNIQNQITNAQKQLQEISSNQEMTLEEKMKKRQEIQQEITNLNQQLRQHQIEQRKERQSKSSSGDDMSGGKLSTGKSGNKENGLSKASMRAMISADSSIKQAQVQGNVATRMEGRAGVLKAEIKQGGGDIEAKEAELAEAEQKAMSATASQMSTLANANQAMEEAAKADQGSRTDETGAESKAGEINHNGQKSDETSADETDGTGIQIASQTQKDSAAVELPAENAAVQTNACTHVDIRL